MGSTLKRDNPKIDQQEKKSKEVSRLLESFLRRQRRVNLSYRTRHKQREEKCSAERRNQGRIRAKELTNFGEAICLETPARHYGVFLVHMQRTRKSQRETLTSQMTCNHLRWKRFVRKKEKRKMAQERNFILLSQSKEQE